MDKFGVLSIPRRKRQSYQKLFDKSEKRVEDIIGKIERLKDGKIKKYDVHHMNDVERLVEYCRENSIPALIKSRVTYCYNRIYPIDNMDEFYYYNKDLLERQGKVSFVVFKGFKMWPEEGQFILRNFDVRV